MNEFANSRTGTVPKTKSSNNITKVLKQLEGEEAEEEYVKSDVFDEDDEDAVSYGTKKVIQVL